MQGKNVRVRSSEGGEFDCYQVTPRGGAKVPAIVLASAVHGVNEDLRAIADEFASHGYIAAAPDLFWRTIPGPLARDDDGTKRRSQPRLEKIRTGEADLADTLAGLRKLPQSNGRAAMIGGRMLNGAARQLVRLFFANVASRLGAPVVPPERFWRRRFHQLFGARR